MRETWTSDSTSAFRRDGDVHTWLECIEIGDVAVNEIMIEVCTHCGLRAPCNRFLPCPGCGSFDRVDVASGVFSAVMTLSGVLPHAQILLDIPNGITIEILHRCRGLHRGDYHSELVVMQLLRCERLSITITAPIAHCAGDVEMVCIEIELEGILEIREDDEDAG